MEAVSNVVRAMSTLKDEYIGVAAKQMSDDIDFEVLSSIMIQSGWTKVVLKPMTSEKSTEIDQWIEHNCKGMHMTRGLVWIFKDIKDANWFTMRWL